MNFNNDTKTTLLGIGGAFFYSLAITLNEGRWPTNPELVNMVVIAALGYFSKGIGGSDASKEISK